MITITFQGTSMDNVVRQIAAFIEKTDYEQKGEKQNGRKKKQAVGPDKGDMGQR